mmetsp:Transcript_31868/g.53271  ORF Transcript_31868/g.53271 Transcript_31868/m.53271 type:complete len:219 (-) Transcript_31868:7-663(-)
MIRFPSLLTTKRCCTRTGLDKPVDVLLVCFCNNSVIEPKALLLLVRLADKAAAAAAAAAVDSGWNLRLLQPLRGRLYFHFHFHFCLPWYPRSSIVYWYLHSQQVKVLLLLLLLHYRHYGLGPEYFQQLLHLHLSLNLLLPHPNPTRHRLYYSGPGLLLLLLCIWAPCYWHRRSADLLRQEELATAARGTNSTGSDYYYSALACGGGVASYCRKTALDY